MDIFSFTGYYTARIIYYGVSLESQSPQRWIVGVTGASGIRYAIRLIDALVDLEIETHAVFSDSAIRVLRDEEGLAISSSNLSAASLLNKESKSVTFYNSKDIGALIASGSAKMSGMVIIPCSMNTLGAIATGVHSHLVHRAADVTMKEARPLILVPRESPLSAIHLENMLKLSRLGVQIVPAMPGFYHRPKEIKDLIDMMVMKVLDAMKISNELTSRWQGS